MYTPKILIDHLNFYLEELKDLTQDETETNFFKHQKEHSLIEHYRDSLKELDEDFHLTADHIKNGLDLEAHPEGGFYREFIRTNDQTIIFYLLPKRAVSSWHSLEGIQEEFKLILGEPLTIAKIDSDGNWKSTEEVKNSGNVIIEKNEAGKFGDWFGAYTDGDYGLVTCKCTGPFEFNKFKMAKEEDLNKFNNLNPAYSEIINKLAPKVLKEETNVMTSIYKFFTDCCSCIGIKKTEEKTPLITQPKNN